MVGLSVFEVEVGLVEQCAGFYVEAEPLGRSEETAVLQFGMEAQLIVGAVVVLESEVVYATHAEVEHHLVHGFAAAISFVAFVQACEVEDHIDADVPPAGLHLAVGRAIGAEKDVAVAVVAGEIFGIAFGVGFDELHFKAYARGEPFTDTDTPVGRDGAAEFSAAAVVADKRVRASGGEDKPVFAEFVGYHACGIEHAVAQHFRYGGGDVLMCAAVHFRVGGIGEGFLHIGVGLSLRTEWRQHRQCGHGHCRCRNAKEFS